MKGRPSGSQCHTGAPDIPLLGFEQRSAKRLEFRIGINLGEVILERDRTYGNSVNVAARLQALAQPGGIYVSGSIYDQVRDKLSFGYDFLGEQQLKNIEKPVRPGSEGRSTPQPSSARVRIVADQSLPAS
jgi:class 3 adenylate cyclase